ncbi:GNAT family N-acetyltransferase [Brachybacterium sp. AOP42-C2-15]|uniref:GNAT family N-acetyltransferase n=1 Tax=unclassified Brachybacterium TaxID=2623841 RepID=UPI003F9C480A
MNHSAAVPSPDGDRRAVVISGIVTTRLRLAPVRAEDLEELFTLHSDPRAFAEDTTAPLTQLAQMRQVLAQWCSAWERDGLGYFTVRARAAAEPDARCESPRGGPQGADGGAEELPAGLLGVVGITALRAGDSELLSAYWRLDPGMTGRGVASEAMRAVLTDPHRGPGGREVIAVTASRNLTSRTLAARLGFRPAAAARPVPGGRVGDVLLVRPAS